MTTETNRLWLLLWEQCNRNCTYCCNKQNDLSKLRTATSLWSYDSIILTGGEPLVRGIKILGIIDDVRRHMRKDARLYMYTAAVENIDLLCMALDKLDGMTITLHTQEDAIAFRRLLDVAGPRLFEGKKMRLKVFRGIYHPGDIPDQFTVYNDIVPLPDCPVPDGDFLRYQPDTLLDSKIVDQLMWGINERGNTLLTSRDGNGVLFAKVNDEQVFQISYEPWNYPSMHANIIHMRDKDIADHINSTLGGWTVVKNNLESDLNVNDDDNTIIDPEDM